MRKNLAKFTAVIMAFAMLLALLPSGAVEAQAASSSTPIRVTVNGRWVHFPDQQPVMVQNRLLVPVGGVFQEMGFTPYWDSVTRIATLTRSDINIIIPAGSNSFAANHVIITPPVPQRMINNRMMLPLRAITDAVGGTAIWDSVHRIAHITVAIPHQPTPTPTPSATPTPTPTPQATPVPLRTAAPQFEGNPANFALGGVAYMLGVRYTDAIWGVHGTTGWSRHNLDRRFNHLNITIGRLDGSGNEARAVRFFGDHNQILATVLVTGPTFHPVNVTVPTAGVSILRIEIEDPGPSAAGAVVVLGNAMLHPTAPGHTPAPTPTPSPVPFLSTVPQFEGSPGFASGGNAYMLGIRHSNSVWGINVPGGVAWSNHNLGGRFTTVTATVGRFDGTGTARRYIRFIGDNNRLIASFAVEGINFQPVNITFNVQSVSILRIEIDEPGTHGAAVVLSNVMIH
ncbi:MAG: copper amine oxidase N-terminal domain-containing protein [Defluviitaleaceae bacterium]|nr:copper amine oxidase N-terminal domain-containing protein [Defluviitaleaceae bacterium]